MTHDREWVSWCPQTFHTSGYRMKTSENEPCGQQVRKATYLDTGLFAVQRIPRYREYFQRRVSEGKAKMHILVAVGRKLLSGLYSMLKTGTEH